MLLDSESLKQHFDQLLKSFDTGISQLTSAEVDFDKYEIDPKDKMTRKEIETQMEIAPFIINNERYYQNSNPRLSEEYC